MNKQKLLGEQPVGKLLLTYSIPAIIGMVVNAFYNIVDRIFIGNIPDIGPLAITGVGVTMPIISIMIGLAMLIGIGATANISIQLGKGNRDVAEKLVGNAVSLSIIISVIATAISLMFVDDILALFGASSSTLPYAKAYINILLWTTVFNTLSFVFSSTIRADGNPRMSANIMIVSCVLNIILDALFIIVFKWGIEGAAIATVLSQLFSTLCGLYYYTKGPSNLKLKKKYLKLDMKLVKIIFAIGSAPFAMQVAASLVQVTANNQLKMYGGDLAIGAMAVISSLAMFFLMPIFGINQGAQPIIGYNYGANKINRAKKALFIGMGWATVFLVISFLIVQTWTELAIKLFNNDVGLLEIAIPGVKIMLIMMPIIAIPIVGSNYFQSIGKAKISMFLSLLRQVIFLIPLILILPNFLGLHGIWIAGAMSDILATLVTIFFLWREFRTEKLGKERISS